MYVRNVRVLLYAGLMFEPKVLLGVRPRPAHRAYKG